MANNKSKKTSTKKSSTKPKAAETKTVKTVKAEATTTAEQPAIVSKPADKKSTNPFKGIFARKSDPNENILTIFKTPKIWGALVGELVGTLLLTILFLTLGVYNPLYLFFGYIGITMAVYALSGAHLNPGVTVGMMVTRRVSAIRGVLYIVAQVVGAWLGLLIANGFRLNGGEVSELPEMTAVTGETFWATFMVELFCMIVLGFFFARAQAYKTPRGVFTYATLISAGFIVAVIFATIFSSYLSLQNNFVLNPAIAIMYQIFPSSAENFGALMGTICLESLVYIIGPMVGSAIGFILADGSAKLAEEE